MRTAQLFLILFKLWGDVLKKIIFLHVPTSLGHFSPTIPLMEFLSQKHEVYCIADPKQIRSLKNSQIKTIEHRVLPKLEGVIKVEDFPKSIRNLLTSLDQRAWLSIKHFEYLREILKSIQADIVIYDEWMAICAYLLSRVGSTKTKWICSNTKMFLPKQYIDYKPDLYASYLGIDRRSNSSELRELLSLVKATLVNAYRSFAIPPGLLMYESTATDIHLNLIYSSEAIQPLASTYKNTSIFIGAPQHTWSYFDHGLINSKKNYQKTPLIYVSLGTVNNENLQFFKQIFETARSTRYNYIVSCGKKIDLSKMEPVPSNIHLRTFVDQKKVLVEASLFVTHGGMNSFTEALCSRTPMLFVPQEGDQHLVSEVGEGLGLGKTVDETKLSVEDLRWGIEYGGSQDFKDQVEHCRLSLKPLSLDQIEIEILR